MSCTIAKDTMIFFLKQQQKRTNKQNTHTRQQQTNRKQNQQVINGKLDNNTNKAISEATQQAMKQTYILAEITNPVLVAGALSCIVTFAYTLE